MNNLLTVLKFTAMDLVSKKAFIFSNLFMLCLLLVFVNIPNIISFFHVDSQISSILILDSDDVLGELNLELESNFIISTDEYIDDFLSEYSYVLELDKIDNELNFTYYTNLPYLNQADILTALIQDQYIDHKLSNLDLTYDEFISINPVFNYEYYHLNESELLTETNYAFASILSFLLFYFVYFYANLVSSSVTTEKTSKIIELIFTSTKSSSVIIGKTLGIGIVGFFQILFFGIMLIVLSYLFVPGDIIVNIINDISLSLLFALLFLFYFFFGYLLFSFMFALTGSFVSRIEDIQTANTPVSLIDVFSFYIAFFSLNDPNSFASIFSRYFPFCSPFAMPINYLSGTVSFVDILLSMILLLLTSIFFGILAIKVYKNTILNFGSKLSFKSIWYVLTKK